MYPAAVAYDRAAFRKPSVRGTIIEDDRAAYDVDVRNDAADRRAGRKIVRPVMPFWPRGQRLVADRGSDTVPTPGTVWRRWADDVRDLEIAGGHLLPEQASNAVADASLDLLT